MRLSQSVTPYMACSMCDCTSMEFGTMRYISRIGPIMPGIIMFDGIVVTMVCGETFDVPM